MMLIDQLVEHGLGHMVHIFEEKNIDMDLLQILFNDGNSKEFKELFPDVLDRVKLRNLFEKHDPLELEAGSDSRSKEFSAPVRLQGEEQNDWGISMLPCLAAVFKWRTFAKPYVFVAILSLIGCTQGLLLFYFRNTSDVWSKQYNIRKDILDWILYFDEFFVAIFAIPISYWASVSHRIVLISLFTICHGILSVLLFIPEISSAERIIISNETVHLCGETYTKIDEDISYGMVAVIIVYEFFSAASYIAFCSIGLVYIDDNSRKNRSSVLAIALASRQLGQQLGIYASWIPMYFKSPHVFRSFIWQGTSLLCIILGMAISMFPKMLPSLLIKKLAVSILELASGISINDISKPRQEGFFAVLRRILSSKILLLTVISTVAIQSAFINFAIFETYFKQSRFFISDGFDKSGYSYSFSLNIATNLMEQPFSILSLLVVGFAMSRTGIKIKYLVLWNIVVFTLASLLFSTNLFVKCDYEELTQLIPTCSVDCGCSLDGTFNPVCLEDRTYFSPCHAGCKVMDRTDGHQFYKNCSCDFSEGTATEGSCNANGCNLVYQLTEVDIVIAGGLITSTLVTNTIIILSSVRKSDKALAFGFELSLLSLVPFLPVRLFYAHIAEQLCRDWYHEKCRIYSPQFSVFLSHSTVILMILGTIVQMLLLCTDLDNPLRKNEMNEDSDVSSIRFASVNSDDEVDIQETQHFCNSLHELYSLGDDHDSDDNFDEENVNNLELENLERSHVNTHSF